MWLIYGTWCLFVGVGRGLRFVLAFGQGNNCGAEGCTKVDGDGGVGRSVMLDEHDDIVSLVTNFSFLMKVYV